MDPRKRKLLDETPPADSTAHKPPSERDQLSTLGSLGGSQELRDGRLLGECLDRLATGDSQGVQDCMARDREAAESILPDLRLIEEIRNILARDEEEQAKFRFTDFTDLERLGGGAMGVVFKARQVSLDRLVALKVIHPILVGDSTALERFKREARVTASLDHPNIVKVHTLGLEGGFPYIAMELCDGENLHKHIDRLRQQADGSSHHQGLDAAHCARVAEMFAGAAEGLHHAHAKKVLHRDLKPSNMILDARGRLRLVDFGLAWVQGQQALTPNERRLGTPLYMSPEQVQGGTANLGPGTDIFSLGVTMYEFLLLRQPFQGRDQRETEHQILHRDPTPPRRLNPRVHRDLETIVLKCLEKEPRRRYGTAEALAQELRRFLRGDPIEARPLALHEKAARRLWRSRRKVFEGSLLCLLLAALFFLLHFTAKDFRLREDRASERRQAAHVERVKRALSHLARSDFLGRPKLTPEVRPLERPPPWQGKMEQPLVCDLFDPLHVLELEFLEMGAELPDIGPDPLQAAVAELIQDVKDFPREAASHYHLARAHWLLENFEAARRSAEEALGLEPAFAPALWLRASILEKKRDPAAGQARADLERAAGGSEWARDWIEAQEAWLNRNWEQAALAYEKLSAGGFDEPEPYLGSRIETFLRKGKAYLEAQSFEEAHRVFAIAADRSLCPEAALFLGKTELLMGKKQLAKKTFATLWEKVRVGWDLPDAAQWRKAVSEPARHRLRAEQVAWDIASVYQEAKDYPSVLEWAKNMGRSAPSLWLQAGLHWRTGDHDRALQAAEEALLLEPEAIPSLLVMGNVHFARGDLQAAETWYRRARSTNDRDARSYLALGAGHEAREEFAAAERWFREAADLEGHRAEAFYNLGRLCAKRGRVEEARTAYETAIGADPGHAHAMNNLGALLDRQELHDEALHWYERACLVAPSLAVARYNAATVHRRRGRYAQALTEYQQAIRLGLDEPAVLGCLSIVQLRLGRYRDAEDSCRRALAAEPENPIFRGMLHHQIGVAHEYQETEEADDIHLLLAREEYRKAVELFPTWVNARNQLGWALANQGKTAEAEVHLRKAIELAPRFGWAYDNLAWLKLKEPVPAREELEAAIVFFEDATAHPRGDDHLLRLIAEYRRASWPDLPSLASVDALFAGTAPAGELQAVWEGFRALPGHDPARARYFAGRLLELEERHEEALAAFEEAAAEIPGRPEPLVARARCLSRLEQAAAAEKLLREGIQSRFRAHDAVWLAWLHVVMVDLSWDLERIRRSLPPVEGAAPEAPGEPDVPDTARSDCRAALARHLEALATGAVRINCGAADDRRAPDGTRWGRDRFHDGGRQYSFLNDHQARLPELADPLLEERYWSPGAAACGYHIPLPPGNYRVVLHFVEAYFTKPGERIFDISLESERRREDYEPFRAGFRLAHRETFDLEVSDGVLDLDFGRKVENPHLAGLEILRR